jgi:hypothetical protein
VGMERVVNRLLSNPDIRASVCSREHRTFRDPQSFWGSPQFKQLDDDCAGALTRADVNTLLLSIGGDGVQLLNWGTRTATVFAVKCEDLPGHLVQKGLAATPLMIVEGVQESAVLNHLLQGVAEFFRKHASLTNGQGTSVPAHGAVWRSRIPQLGYSRLYSEYDVLHQRSASNTTIKGRHQTNQISTRWGHPHAHPCTDKQQNHTTHARQQHNKNKAQHTAHRPPRRAPTYTHAPRHAQPPTPPRPAALLRV